MSLYLFMKKTHSNFLVILCAFSLLFINTPLKSQQPVYCFPSPEGYGAAVTGGGNATPVTVSTYADLKTQLTSSGSKVILVSGTITIPSGGEIAGAITNKTLLGLPGAHLVNLNQTASTSGILYLKDGSTNVIIRNILFEGPGAYDVDGNDNLSCEATKFWVDHCEFQDGMDGNFDITKNGNIGTVSWCKFTYLKPPKVGGSGGSNDHRFSDLIGSSASSLPASGHYQITFQCCYWAAGCVERMPRTRNAAIHLVDCYYNTVGTGNLAIGVGGGVNNSTLYVENCNFENVKAVYRSYDSTDGGSESLTFDGCLKGIANVGSPVPKPTYTYTVFPAANVAEYVGNVTCGAGATLQITSDGHVSSSCTTTELINPAATSNVKLYSSDSGNSINISLNNHANNDTEFDIYSLNGQKIMSNSQWISSGQTVTLYINQLNSGIYLCQIRNSNLSTVVKFIK